ncbi:MAG: hypothetical protein P8010_19880 [Desulfosarcinaceae bacterium]
MTSHNAVTLVELEGRWQQALEATRTAVGRHPGCYRELKKRVAQIVAMVDVIDDDPLDRWLSVCFYGEMAGDPKENGDFVPAGLLGEDTLCFDIEAWEENLLA